MPEAVYNFADHPPQGIEPRLKLEPSGGSMPEGGVRPIRVVEITANGGQVDRTSEATLQSSDESILAVQDGRVVGIQAGQARITARLELGDLRASADFTVTPVDQGSLQVVPAHLVLRVGEQRSLTVRSASSAATASLTDQARLAYQVIEGDDVASVDDSGAVTGRSPGTATLRVVWDGDAQVTVPVTVRPRQLFSGEPLSSAPALGSGEPGASREPDSTGASEGLKVDVVDVRDEEQYSTADIRISVPQDWGEVEFRVSAGNGAMSGTEPWTTARLEGQRRVATLQSPPLVRRSGRLHRVLLEARVAGRDQVERYALRFQLETRARGEGVGAPNE